MRVSQFEIYRICQRSLEGLGAPYGIDRDGAEAAVWLEARGLPGLALLAGDLEYLAKPEAFTGMTPPTAAVGAAAALDAAGRPAVAFLGAALDFLRLLAQRSPDGRGRLAIQNCRSPLYLLPAAVAAAGAVTSFRLAWGGVAAEIASDGVSIRIASGLPASQALGERGPCAVELTSGKGVIPAEPGPAPRAVLSAADLGRAYDRALDKGVPVDAGIWQRLSITAARVQVPASEASRLKGAGGGDANA